MTKELTMQAEQIRRNDKQNSNLSVTTEYYYEENDKPKAGDSLINWDASKWKYKIELYTRTFLNEEGEKLNEDECHLIWTDKEGKVVKIEKLTEDEGISFSVNNLFGYYVCSIREF